MKKHRRPSIANYVNWPGRTVRRIREEAALQEAIESYLKQGDFAPEPFSAGDSCKRRAVRQAGKDFRASKAIGRKLYSTRMVDPQFIASGGHAVTGFASFSSAGCARAVLSYSFAPCSREQILNFARPSTRDTRRNSRAGEDHDVTNQFSAMGSLKPGLVRLLTTVGVLSTVDYAARHIVRPGRLGRIRTIHFARWVFLDGTKRMIFCSNYDGSVESYMDDFINKTGFGLNASFSNGIGYPTTNWLVLDGCGDERKYVEYLRRHTLPTQVWYKAYPGLTAIDLERNGRIRQGLEILSLSDQEASEWVALL